MFVEPEAARIKRRRTLAFVGPFRADGDVDEACLEVDDAVFGVEESASESDIEFGAVESDTDIILEPDGTIELGGHEFILEAEELHFRSRDLSTSGASLCSFDCLLFRLPAHLLCIERTI